MKLVEFLARYNYSETLMIVVLLTALIYSLRNYSRHRALRILPYYFGGFLLLTGIEFYWYCSPKDDRFAVDLYNTSAAFSTVFEFWVFSLLLLHFIAGSGRRLAIKLNMAIFSLAEILLYFRTLPRIPIVQMNLLQAIALVLPCVLFFYEVLTNMDTRPLKDRPSFWIVSGIIYQCIYNLCLLLSMEYMGRFSDGAYVFAILFYCLLFVLFMRAYKCRPEESKPNNI